MQNIKVKRLTAYFIDLLIISFIAMLVSEIKFLNPYRNEYEQTIERYNEFSENLGNHTVDDIMGEEYADLVYDVSYYGMSYNIILVVVIILYFTLFPFFNSGMTVGKRLLKIQMVHVKEDKLHFWQYLVKAILTPIFSSLVLYNSLTYIFLTGLTFICDGTLYLKISTYIIMALSIFCYIDVALAATKEDGRSLTDKIAKVKVIDYVRN